ncbi:TetR/AcrR family transcriptional regulator [Thaumasiovibrio sp. DFM-14]|uniref:TetR/AcrR family transcriptional regulator n=1 Tax=Thaumasiovibrio sp. DFM-14 TaxID=3384792 RepID=UPI0039A07830
MPTKKERILIATEMLLAQYGFAGLSMAMIAKEANIAAGSIYTYFADKEDLLSQLYKYVLQRVAEHMQKNIDTTTPLQQQHQAMWQNLWKMSQSAQAPIINHGQFSHLPRPFKCDEQELIFPLLAAFFEHGKQVKSLKPLPNAALFMLGFEPAISLGKKHHSHQIQLDDDAISLCTAACWDAISTSILEHSIQ